MKKLFVLALALVMVLAMSTAVFAALPADETGDVVVKYTPADNTGTAIYGATIAWTDLEVTYSYGKNWNPETLQYDVTTGASWSDDDITITITNKSNAKIWSAVTYEANNGLSADITGDGEIAAAGVGAATTQTVAVVISGTPTSLTEADGGSLTVALSSTNPQA